MNNIKKTVGIFLCIVMMLSIVACAGNNSDSASQGSGSAPGQSGQTQPDNSQENQQGTSGSSPKNDTITVAAPFAPANLAPFGTSDAFTDFVVYSMYESLYVIDDITGEVKPLIMENYELSDDGLVYTFHLKKGIKDTNGNEITASDCVFSFNLANNSPRAIDTMNIDFEKTEAVDTYTFKLCSLDPGSIYISKYAHIYIVSEKSFKESPDEMVTTPVGTGPYKLDTWTQGISIKLTANEDYWGGGFDVKNLEIKTIGEPSQRTTTLLTGETNFIYEYNISDGEHINSTAGLIADERETNNVVNIGFDCSEDSIVNDINFRKAVCLALNNEALTKMIFLGYNEPAISSQPKCVFDYSESWEGCEFYEYDVDAAKEYLSMSNYDGSTLVFVTVADQGDLERMAEAIQRQLKEINVNVDIQTFDSVTVNTMVMRQPEAWDIYLSTMHTFSNLAIETALNLHLLFNTVHIYGDLFAQFAEYCQTGISSPSEQQRREYTDKAIWLWQDNCTLYSICFTTMKNAFADYITNINCYSTGKIAWHEIVITG